jgi:biopolymer transport protein ExbD
MNLRPPRPREEPEVNLISLVDVVLLLLIFFMLTTSFVRESQLAVRLPEAAAQAPVEAGSPPLEITVTERGVFFVNGRALVDNRAETLAAAIRRLRPDQAGPGAVTISADARAAHQDVVTAMDVAGRLGISEVRIATVRPRAE